MPGVETGFLPSLGWAILNSFWQLAFLWVIYQLLTTLWVFAKPASKSILASLFLIIGFTWFLLTFFSQYLSSTSDPSFILFSLTGVATDIEVNTLVIKILPVASVCYLLLLLFPVLHFIRNYRYVQVIRRHGLSKINVDWRLYIKNVAASMGITKTVSIWISEFVTSPVTVGFLKPIILVPIAAINQLSTAQLEAVLLHELSHIKRYDFFINLIINVIQTVLYFNPFVKAFVKIVEREREKSCDEIVLQFQYDSHEYASALLTLEKTNYKQRMLAMASGGKRNDLLIRIETILGVNKKPAFIFTKMVPLLAGLACMLAINILFTDSTPINTKETNYAYLSSPFAGMTNSHYQINDPAKNLSVIKNTIAYSENTDNKISERETSLVTGKQQPPALNEAGKGAPSPIITPYKTAGFETKNPVPELNSQQEEQVQEALVASRKVLENAQWKTLEKNIADVLTEKEKEELKASYRDEVSKFDWDKWEDNLRRAYEKVDWDKVNYQLTNAVNQIRIDSLQKVYNNVIVKLNDVQKELSLKGLPGIPDSDITLKALEQKKQEAVKTLMNLKLIRNKRVVHL